MRIMLFYLLLIIFFCSCTKENERLAPGTFEITPFDVFVDTKEVKAGEPLYFKFEGNADTINFFSGEFGKDYRYVDGRTVSIENISMSIRTRSSYGEQESLSILLSQDYNGEEGYENVIGATWHDMTLNFNIPQPEGTMNVEFESGPIDISEFIEDEEEPYYIAIRNNVKEATDAGGKKPTQWYFYGVTNSRPGGFSVRGSANGNEVDIVGLVDADWKIVNKGYIGPRESMPSLSPEPPASPTSLFFGRNSPSSLSMDSWAVTKALSTKRDISGDRGTIIKRITDLPLSEYKYIYEEPGEYFVAFEAVNHDGSREIIEIKVIVAP